MKLFVCFLFLFFTLSCCQECGTGEVHYSCGPCEKTCMTVWMPCPPQCGPPGCYCKQGWVRDSRGYCKDYATCHRVKRLQNKAAPQPRF
uniref:TIL domain-containing protein n=1 Tax=Panagrolaimus sp. JU765 TaxID=591449 RepID=A0AC34PXN8_9BILA